MGLPPWRQTHSKAPLLHGVRSDSTMSSPGVHDTHGRGRESLRGARREFPGRIIRLSIGSAGFCGTQLCLCYSGGICAGNGRRLCIKVITITGEKHVCGVGAYKPPFYSAPSPRRC